MGVFHYFQSRLQLLAELQVSLCFVTRLESESLASEGLKVGGLVRHVCELEEAGAKRDELLDGVS